jgi:hypothetical protein
LSKTSNLLNLVDGKPREPKGVPHTQRYGETCTTFNWFSLKIEFVGIFKTNQGRF